MGELKYSNQGEIDLLAFPNDLNDDTLDALRRTISTLRQQGCQKLVLVGKEIERITSHNLEIPAGAIRIFRTMEGKITLAEFPENVLQLIRRVSWYKYLNVFKTIPEAITFLDPER